jgi:hypothetical protein
MGGEGHTIVGAEARGQAKRFEQAGEHGFGFGHTGGRERLRAEANAAVAIGHHEGITVQAVTGVNLAFEIGAPHLVGRRD